MRVLVGDEPVQTRKAEKAFLAHASGDGVFVSLVVLAEVAWVLAAAYAWNRSTIHARMSRLVRTRGVMVEDFELVENALEGYASGNADFADYLILGKATSTGHELLTFDKKLAREASVSIL